MGEVRIGTLQWATGVFCVTTGALMLMAPHQFRLPEYAPLRPHMPWLGGFTVLAGVVMVRVAASRRSGVARVLAHLLVAASLSALAVGFLGSGIWTGAVGYATLALSVVFAPLLAEKAKSQEARPGSDLFAVAIGAGAAINGVLLLFAPHLFSTRFYDVVRPHLGWYGAAFLAGGVAVVASYAQSSQSGIAVKLSGWAVAAAFLAFGLPNLPQATWTGVAYYGGFGALLVLLPWASILRRVDLASLRTRLALSLAAATAVPLLVIVVIGAEYLERQAVAEVLNGQKIEAAMLAQHIADEMSQHRATVESLAGQPALVKITAEARQALLQSLYTADPNGVGFVVFNASGRAIAESGDIHLDLMGLPGYPSPEEAEGLSPGSTLVLKPADGEGPVIVYWAPVYDQSGRFVGAIASGIDSTHLAGVFKVAGLQPGQEAFLTDAATGRVLARSAVAGDGLSLPPVVSTLGGVGEAGPGALEYLAQDGEWVVGYASVPALGWEVAVQRPRAVALADILAGRDLASLVVILVLALGMVSGALVAGLLTAPLHGLAEVAERLGAGDTEAPLPSSGIAEVRRLAAAFGDMRDRLAARTAERERAEDALRFLAEASNLLASSLDHETTLASVARLIVPRMADWCSVSIVDEEGEPRRVALAHSDPGKEAILRDLHRRYPLEMGQNHPVAVVLRTGEPWIMADVPLDFMEATAQRKELFGALREAGLGSCMVVPLRARGRVLGAIMLSMGASGRHYGAGDLTLAQDLARRCATAVDNALLYQEAQEAIRARDEFLSVAAHELKTPITSLRGFAQVSIRQLQRDGPVDPIRVQRAMEVIDRQSDKLARLVVQLLDVARIQAGRLDLNREQVELTDMVAGVVANAQASTTKHNLILRTPSSVWASVDPIRLEQVVTNLVDNAIKYSPGGGDIEVDLVESRSGGVQLSVRDHGIGIPAEQRGRIFDRFYQVDNGGRAGGMGLGLYISRHIVELHGGRIDVEAPQGGGTRFVVSLPPEGVGAP